MATHSPANPETPTQVSARQIFRYALSILLAPVVLFLAAGTLAWPQGWTYALFGVGYNLAAMAIVRRVHPDLLHERATAAEARGVPAWDKTLTPLMGLGLPLLTALVAGLDHRFGWTAALPLWVNIAGFVILVGGYTLAAWAVVANRYFSSYVRIQRERDHQVVDQGPYRLVRHPGYAGNLLAYLGVPFLLGSWWTFIPVALAYFVFVLRTAREDRYLQENLPGYAAYTQRTRYCLLPGVW